MKLLSFSSFVLYIKFLYCEQLESLLRIDADGLFELKDLATQFENDNLLKICEYLNEKFNTTDQNIVRSNDQKIKDLIEKESPKLFKCFENQLYNQKKYNDVILNIEYKKKKKKIPANKSLLIARTKYFKKVIQNQSRSSGKSNNNNNNNNNNNQNNNSSKKARQAVINLKVDFQPSLFSDLNNFLYTNAIKFKNYQHCADLLRLAKFVSQNTLMAFCQLAIVDIFIPKISNKNLLTLYFFLKPLNLRDLSELILYYMGLKKDKIKKLKQYKKLLDQNERNSFEKCYYKNKNYLSLQSSFQKEIATIFGLKKIEIDKNDKKK